MTDETPTESIRLDATLHQRLLAACAEPVYKLFLHRKLGGVQ